MFISAPRATMCGDRPALAETVSFLRFVNPIVIRVKKCNSELPHEFPALMITDECLKLRRVRAGVS